MLYQRSLEIERRLELALRLITTGKYSTPTLANALQVSIPTVSRCISALRDRGYRIRAKKVATGWSYTLDSRKAMPQAGLSNKSRAAK